MSDLQCIGLHVDPYKPPFIKQERVLLVVWRVGKFQKESYNSKFKYVLNIAIYINLLTETGSRVHVHVDTAYIAWQSDGSTYDLTG